LVRGEEGEEAAYTDIKISDAIRLLRSYVPYSDLRGVATRRGPLYRRTSPGCREVFKQGEENHPAVSVADQSHRDGACLW